MEQIRERIRTPGVMALSAILTILLLFVADLQPKGDEIIMRWRPPNEDVVEMPLVLDSDPSKALWQTASQEDRGLEYRKYLAVSLKIRASGASGSGTIIFYDPKTGEAYVTSCGHLWNGSRSAEELRQRPIKASVVTWYHNENKLPKPKQYEAQVLFWSSNRGFDSSLLKFRPDWDADFFPIAPSGYEIQQGQNLHSLGCDGSREVAHYDVEFVEYRGLDLITRRNSPRPGRSGGGLLSSDGFYVGTCWGTSDTKTGGGVGYFTPLSAIRKVFTENGYDWLLEVSRVGIARELPIRDWADPNRRWEPEYIPMPGLPRVPVPRYDFYLKAGGRLGFLILISEQSEA